jgi:regulator of protease activity HflC (stomatin/prohibitin superfamily)
MNNNQENETKVLKKFMLKPLRGHGNEAYEKSVPIVVRTYVILVVGVILFLTVFFGTWFTVGAGEVGIVTRFGEVERVQESGLGFKIPLVESVSIMNTRVQKEEIDSSAATKDLQDVNAKLALNYSIDQSTALKIYKELGKEYKDNIIIPALHESFKAGSAQYTAEELITKRAEAKEKILDVVKGRLDDYGVVVADLNIVDLNFSDEFNKAVEAKQVAQQQAEKAKQDLARIEIEAQQTKTKADAEAYANEKRKQSLTEVSIQQQWIDKWDGKLPSTLTGDSGLMLNLGGK